MELLILSPDEKLLATIDEELLISAVQKEAVNAAHTLPFQLIGNHEKAIHVKEGNLVAFEDVEGDFQLYEIVLVTDIHGDGSVKEALCEHANVELLDEHIEDIRPSNQTAEYALTRALEGTRWQPGIVASLGLGSTNFYRENPKSAIKKIIDVWGGEVRYRVTMADNVITGRYVDLLARRGSDRGKTYEHGKDLTEITRSIDISTIKTAVRGYGKGEEIGDGYSRRITFKGVVWSIANGDPMDKPAGQDWLGDEDAREVWGRPEPEGTRRHRFGQFEDSEEEDPEQLLKNAYAYLLSVNKPIANYNGKVVDLFRLKGEEYAHERAILGDTAAVLDAEVAPAIEVKARIIELNRDLLDPSQDEAILGQYLPMYSDQDAEVDKIVAKVKGNSGVWDNPDLEIRPDKYPDIKPSQPVVTANGSFETVQLFWEYPFGEYYTQAFEVYASEVQGFTTYPENLVFRGMANGYNFIGETNKQYYFRVRAINYQGSPSDFSAEVTATTARIISDDILFGEDIAAKLRKLSLSAQLIADGVLGIEKLKEGAMVGDVFLTDGITYISEGAVGSLAIADAAIERLHLKDGIVGTLQIEDAAITNAKVADISADKLTFGVAKGIELEAVTIRGSVFQSVAVDSTMWIEGGDIRLNSTYGQYLNLNPRGLTGFNEAGEILFQATKTWVTSGILGTNTTNVYLGAQANGEARMVDIAGIPGDGLVASYSYIPVRASGFYGNFWNINGGLNGIHLYARPFTDGELRVTLNGTTDQYRDLRVRTIYANSINPNTGQSASRHLYVRAFSDGEIRVTAVDTTENYIAVRASGYYGTHLDSTATHIYIRPAGDPGEARVTVRGTLDVYQPIRAKEFITDVSVRENKMNIEVYEEHTLDVWRNMNAYLYNRKTDKKGARKQFGMMIDELPQITHSDASDSFRMYGLVSYIALGLKDTIREVDSIKVDCSFISKRIDKTEKAIEKLQAEVKKLKGAA